MTDQFKIDKSIALEEAQIMQKAPEEVHIEQEAPKRHILNKKPLKIHILNEKPLKRHRYLKIVRSQNDEDPEPRNVEECRHRNDWPKWKEAIQAELNSLTKREVFGPVVQTPEDVKPVGYKWVFVRKRNENNEIIRYKARLVAQGFSQRPGIDYEETYSPVMDVITFRFLISLAVSKGLDMRLMDDESLLGPEVPYLSAIGALMYLANCTRPDIAFSVNLLARYSSAPTRRHWNGIKHILRYLRGTTDMGLFYSRESKQQLLGYADAGYLSDPHKGRSQTGYCFNCNGTAISWRSVKQTMVTSAYKEEQIEDLKNELKMELYMPIRKGLERLEARWYMSIYQDETSHDTTLLKLAKLDFNLVQSLHKEELSNIARWLERIRLCYKATFARDRLVEGYFWILGYDIYDAYGTFEELELFTEAIERSPSRIHETLLCALLDVYKEIEEEMEKKGNQYRVQYAIEAHRSPSRIHETLLCGTLRCVQEIEEEMEKEEPISGSKCDRSNENLVRAYFHEAKWFHEGSIQQWRYMGIALVTSGYYMLTTMSFIGMGEIVTKEAFDWVISDPKIITASAVICRLTDDISSYKVL
ncbi:Valencene synthase [Vitis vinifera]|uniref:Valencene synthase n=1 Tax=Vitis vinifera TaxID=29760 RepID=A0A438G4K1_VITVI|nr:Valencene synthase [Vitis vinifera]